MNTMNHTICILVLSLGCCGVTSAGFAAETNETAVRKKLAGAWRGFAVEGTGERPDRGPVKLEVSLPRPHPGPLPQERGHVTRRRWKAEPVNSEARRNERRRLGDFPKPDRGIPSPRGRGTG